MITFKQFLSESRTKPVSVDELIKWADNHAKGYLSGNRFIYRGGSGRGSGIMIGSSLDGEPRKSKAGPNNYTLWIDGHPSFKGYPKRSRSWIAIDNKTTATGFGNPSILIIEDKAKVGLIGHEDIWYIEVDPKHHTTMEEFNPAQESVLRHLGEGHASTYEELRSALEYATLERVQKIDAESSADEHNVNAAIKAMEFYKVDNLLELWEKLITPELFPKPKTGATVSEEGTFGEVWIEGTVGFISATADRVSEAERETLTKWAEAKYPEFAKAMTLDWEDYDF